MDACFMEANDLREEGAAGCRTSSKRDGRSGIARREARPDEVHIHVQGDSRSQVHGRYLVERVKKRSVHRRPNERGRAPSQLEHQSPDKAERWGLKYERRPVRGAAIKPDGNIVVRETRRSS